MRNSELCKDFQTISASPFKLIKMGSEMLQGRALEMSSEFRRNGDLGIRTVEVDAKGHVRKTNSERPDGHLNLRFRTSKSTHDND
jgi:hypothetical protein